MGRKWEQTPEPTYAKYVYIQAKKDVREFIALTIKVQELRVTEFPVCT